MNTDVNTAAEQIQTSSLPGGDKLSDTINRLMEHPELISMVANAIGLDMPASAVQEVENKEISKESGASVPASQSTAVSGDVLGSIIPTLSKLSSASGGRKAGRHEALLCALKPYLSDGRSQAVDYIIKISQVSDILGKLR